MGHHVSKNKYEGQWNQKPPLLIPRESLAVVEQKAPEENWPAALKANRSILSEEESLAASLLLELDQHHLFKNWDPPGVKDDLKHAFFEQIKSLSTNYRPGEGGLIAYINNARKLLKDSKNGVNPLDGWVPNVPTGTFIEPCTPEYERLEELGLREIGSCGFVLVAGGLGERLGYNGIKISLPTETLTNTSYIELYCQQILAIQERYGRIDMSLEEPPMSEDTVKVPGEDSIYEDDDIRNRVPIPLAIMVSDDTAALTEDLLRRNSYFGLKSSQVTLLKQSKVAALLDNEAHLATEGSNQYVLNTKPHGHGDVHALLHSSGTVRSWQSHGVKWVYFFQDTNALSIMSLAAMLGVSIDQNLEVNSRSVPRVAKQAVGGIVRLTKPAVNGEGNEEMTVNIEYNQLDPLLRSSGYPDGDTNDPDTGYSLFPGNVNQLLFHLDPYAEVLQRTQGIMGEFVNPKYTDSTKTSFKKPTRLECMMQDYPKLLPPSSRVGFTTSPAWFCYSPVKNNSKDAAAAVLRSKQSTKMPPACPMSGESDQYYYWAQLLRLHGVVVESPPESAAITALGITAQLAPRIVLHPSCCVFPCELKSAFPHPVDVCISYRSSLILSGQVVLTSLILDGSLRLSANVESSLQCTFHLSDPIMNAGNSIKVIDEDELSNYPEVIQMRGYKIVPHEEHSVQTECGKEGPALFTSDDWSRLSIGHDSGDDSWEVAEATGLRFTFSRATNA